MILAAKTLCKEQLSNACTLTWDLGVLQGLLTRCQTLVQIGKLSALALYIGADKGCHSRPLLLIPAIHPKGDQMDQAVFHSSTPRHILT